MGPGVGHQQMAANFGGGPTVTYSPQLGEGPGAFGAMKPGIPADLSQVYNRSE